MDPAGTDAPIAFLTSVPSSSVAHSAFSGSSFTIGAAVGAAVVLGGVLVGFGVVCGVVVVAFVVGVVGGTTTTLPAVGDPPACALLVTVCTTVVVRLVVEL